MSRNRKLVKVIRKIYQNLYSFYTTLRKKLFWLLRTFLVTKNRQRYRVANAGFVLPTVAMVSLVVVLLTTAILFRSFERSKNASNVRVNEAVLQATKPAIDRAQAKIQQLFTDPTLPRSTPSDGSLYNAFVKDIRKYTFGDETPLKVSYDINGDRSITEPILLEEKEATTTAWRFPVDTDNNGKFDSYSLYTINFRSPSRGNDGKFNKARKPLDARTPPMDDGSLGGLCAAAKGTSASLIGESGWYRSGATLKKSFFVYAATVPITEAITGTGANRFEVYKGNKSFSALEFQQDQERVPIINNAVVYEDDLEITPGSGLRINGSVFTNSNLLTAQTNSAGAIRFYQVSSPDSCYFQPQNSKIVVGGNVGNGRITNAGEGGNVTVDLYRVKMPNTTYTAVTNLINATNKSANNTASQIAYNTKAYAERISALVDEYRGSNKATWGNYSNDPKDIQENIRAKLADNSGLDVVDVRRKELESYFKKRTRRIPFSETLTNPATILQGVGSELLRPIDGWIAPTSTGLSLNLSQLEATEPNKLKETYKEQEQKLGDRVLAGNNLPALWFKNGSFVGKEEEQEVGGNTEWNDWSDPKFKSRTRSTKIDQLISLEGVAERDGFFEDKASEMPKNILDNVGGMRIVTGAGIYVDGLISDPNASFPWDGDVDAASGTQHRSYLHDSRPTWDTNLVDPANTDTTGTKVKVTDLRFKDAGTFKDPIIVHPDSMPMTGGNNVTSPQTKSDLLMRATAVYHYKGNSGNAQTPIACVSSYYDPTNPITAQNKSAFTSQFRYPEADQITTDGKSNNGIVYPAPYAAGARATGISTYSRQLRQQARLVFPNGRFVNEPLRRALERIDANKTLSMADNSAIDTAVCAIRILNDAAFAPDSTPFNHGTIYETAFLDARQVKALEENSNVLAIPSSTRPNYTRSIEERQPLEIRATVINLDGLRRKTIPINSAAGATTEYLLPNSGIIYATRDDALLDISDASLNDDGSPNIDSRKLISPTDNKIDPTRRPSAIMLIEGDRLDRQGDYREVEKGLILATNLPAYIKGNFNRHSKNGATVEEFTTPLSSDWSNFYSRTTADSDFACRKSDPRLSCPIGDRWRPATVIADAVTILSRNFRFGFRSEGDYDLRNNEGDARSASYKGRGFFDNNYMSSSLWFDNTGFPKGDFNPVLPGNQANSSYVNNFVTPIQRRVRFNEYLMEICTKVPVTTCTAADWSVDGAGKKATDEIGETYTIATHKAGTTVELAEDLITTDLNPELRRYARRVAFARNSTNRLVLDSGNLPVPLGISSIGTIEAFPRNTATISIDGTDRSYPGATTLPRVRAGELALWYRTTTRVSGLPSNAASDTSYGHDNHLFYRSSDGNPFTGSDENEQPLLVPVLQIHVPDGLTNLDPGTGRTDLPGDANRGIVQGTTWMPTAVATTTNLVIAAGDTPGRPAITSITRGESNGGLENYVRYLEQWRTIDSNISGSLIQYRRSAYATAPWQSVQTNWSDATFGQSIFGNDYPQYYKNNVTEIATGQGMTPFYTPPNRQWGFDVGLLSQLPDLFAQQFTLPPARKPNQFFREVGRDDEWVQTLLCAKTLQVRETNGVVSATVEENAVNSSERPEAFCDVKTGG